MSEQESTPPDPEEVPEAPVETQSTEPASVEEETTSEEE